MGTAAVESADVIRLILQFCKENGLHRTLQTLQEESRVSLNTVDSLDGLMSDINHGRWDVVLQAVSYLSLPINVQVDLYTQVVLELAELKDQDTANHLLRETTPMIEMKQENPERWIRLEHQIKKSHFDARDAYDGMPKEKKRRAIAQEVLKHVTVAPPSRLLAMIGQAMKWQQHTGLIPPGDKIDVFRGISVHAVEEAEQIPRAVGKTVKFGAKSHAECAVFSPDGQYCVSGSVDGFIEVWDHQTGMLRKDLQYQEDGAFMMHDKSVISVSFSKDSELLATGSADGQLKVWRIASGQCARSFVKAHGQGITSVSWSKDSGQLLTSSFDHTARAHGLKSGKTLKEYRGHTSYVNSATYSKDNSKVITASSDGHVNVFDAKTTEIISSITPPPPPNANSAMTYSVISAIVPSRLPAVYGDHGEMFFVCTSSNHMMLMNLTGQVVKSFSSGKREKGDFVQMITSPKGEYLYGIGEDQTLYSFSVATGELEGALKLAEKEIIGLTHHPSRNILAYISAEGTLVFLKA
jgi:WD40 repeat-containing protein SMU1